ncbi:MAG: hypothetical protein GC138_08420 [Gammaproteobacteria bacterium]|nr:hypothetical protein [Gammaproteobacteria bacterium]
MSGLLPEMIDPIRFARTGQVIKGVIPMQQMNRLAEIVNTGDSAVEVDLRFSFNERGQCLMEGEMAACVDLPCQRCLRMMRYPVRVRIKMAACKVGREDELADGVDPLPTENGRLNLFLLAEDEIILGLPIVAMHPLNECAVGEDYKKDVLIADHEPKEETQRPFAGLAEMLAKQKGGREEI